MKTLTLLCCALSLAASQYLQAREIPTQFTDSSGAIRHPLSLDDKAGSVLIFYWHDCPICNSYVPEINRLCAKFPNFAFYLVDVDPEWTASQAKTHADEFGFRAPYLLDPQHSLVELAKARVTPEAVVFGKNDKILYRGRIDDTYASLSIRRGKATTHELLDALLAISQGRTAADGPPPVGCIISDLPTGK
jgi:hypothetical protein